MSVHYCSEDVSVPKFQKRRITSWIKQTIVSEEKTTGEISFIFCSDNYLLEVNKQYLNHDYFTDIITFDYVEDKVISGDIFISCDRVKENAAEFGTGFDNELMRIIIHGVLHLLGYKDKNKKDKLLMTDKEDFYLNVLSNS
ncbi:MAG TPA: rRNA maturation RNase YbeY [Prolixibacteraceae bacterium]|jgi:rRNA maturation RNase YbeY|nr:rRNA maturation RNase YbeY [Prolixibacteraceae bacterium]